MEGTSIIMTPPFPWTFLIFGHRPWPMPAPIEKKNSVQSGTISRIREADGTKPNYRIPVPLWKFTWKPVKEKKIYPSNLDPIHSSLIKSFFPEILILICALADRVFGRFDADTRREMEQKKRKNGNNRSSDSGIDWEARASIPFVSVGSEDRNLRRPRQA